MKKPLYITVHCSATPCDPSVTRDVIRKWHTSKGWLDIGYHMVIESSGELKLGRDIHVQGAHVSGHNGSNIGICLVGGVDRNGKPEFNYTTEQIQTLQATIVSLCAAYDIPRENVKGHRDWFGDTNGDGVINSEDWLKDCPCFDVQSVVNFDEVK